MPRLFFGNFDFEHRLAKPKGQLPAKLDRINAELATSWLAIANDGDYLWTPQPIEASFFENAAAEGLPRVIPVFFLNDVPRGVECVPWGWTDDIRQLCDKHGWVRNDPPDAAVRAANSRRLSAALEQEWLVGPEFAGEATSIEQIERYLSFHEPSLRWVIKAEFGMSGRERLIGSGSPTTADRNWITKRLAADGVVFFEPWVERLAEVGIQINIPRQGDPQLIEITPMFVSEQGQYSGSEFRTVPSRQSQLTPGIDNWDSAIEVALRAARRIQDLGYFGPLGIDAMRYRNADGMVRLRPLQDINARWTMGRLSLGWRRLLKHGESGFWLHGSQSFEIDSLAAVMTLRAFLKSRQIRLSPKQEDAVRAMMESLRGVADEFVVGDILQRGDCGTQEAIDRTLNLMAAVGLIRMRFRDDDQIAYIPKFPAIARRISTTAQIVGGQTSTHQSVVLINK